MELFWTIIGGVVATVISAFLLWLFREGLLNLIKKPNSNTEKRFSAEDVNALMEQARESEKKRVEENLGNLEVDLKKSGNHAGAKKLAEAQTALKNGELSKADKILAKAEANKKLTGKNAAYAASARGHIAEQEIRWNDAVEHYARAVQFDSCFETLISLQRLLRFTKDYDSALSVCLDAQKAAIMQYGKDSEQYAHSVSGHALIHNKKGEYKLAEPIHKESLKIRQNVFGEKHPAVALCLNNLGIVYQRQGRYKEAEDFSNQAINMYKETGGLNSKEAAMSIYILAHTYFLQRNYEKAEPLFKQALEIRKEILGLRHPATANSFNSLGNLYAVQWKYKEAEPFIRQALEIFEAIFGHDHPRTKQIKQDYEKNKERLAHAEKTTPQ